MNRAYKHLESKLKLAELTLTQWVGVLLCLGIATLWAFHLSPFSGPVTAFTSVYVAGIPAIGIYLSSTADFDFWLYVRSAIRWRRTQARYIPSPVNDCSGYTLRQPELDSARTHGAELPPDLATLWE